MPAYVAVKAVPHDGIPLEITVPHIIVIKCGDIRTVRAGAGLVNVSLAAARYPQNNSANPKNAGKSR